MSSHTLDKLIYMANQIAREFGFQQPGVAAEATADHLRRYWDPRMKAMIRDHAKSGGDGLSATAAEAVALLGQDKASLRA
jgi:formate dehydrogenase subunit delta